MYAPKNEPKGTRASALPEHCYNRIANMERPGCEADPSALLPNPREVFKLETNFVLLRNYTRIFSSHCILFFKKLPCSCYHKMTYKCNF